MCKADFFRIVIDKGFPFKVGQKHFPQFFLSSGGCGAPVFERHWGLHIERSPSYVEVEAMTEQELPITAPG